MQDSYQNQPVYTRRIAVQIAEISLEFLQRCEAEHLIEEQTVPLDEPAYTAQDIRQLALIRRLHEVLGIDMQDMEVVLHLRSQLLDLQMQIEEVERQWTDREEQLLAELIELRRQLSDDAEWK